MPRRPRPLDPTTPPTPRGGYRHGIKGGTTLISVRLSPDQVAAMESWAPGYTRTEAIRRALSVVVPGFEMYSEEAP